MRPISSFEDLPKHPRKLWEIFYSLTQCPRPSKHEEKARAWVKEFAALHNLECLEDKAHNLLIKVPGSKGRESESALIIQNHLDMVTDKLPGMDFDFLNDPLKLYEDKGMLSAEGTTLGADNGLGCAAALALAVTPKLSHPPLRILLTMDEETGLHGALNLDPGFLEGGALLNLDTEEWKSFYIGCAGGKDYEIKGQLEQEEEANEYKTLKVYFSGAKGGHSGLEIHKERVNALKALSFLASHFNKDLEGRVTALDVGKAHNIIPRDGTMELAFPLTLSDDEILSSLEIFHDDFSKSVHKDDSDIEINWEFGESSLRPLTTESHQRLLGLLLASPHGVQSICWDMEGPLVTSSSNFARFILTNSNIYTLSSVRFTHTAQLREWDHQMNRLCESFGLELHEGCSYPSWSPRPQGPLIQMATKLYEKEFGCVPEVKAIHAGLECGILSQKGPGLPMISLGPTIINAHSPDEAIEIDTVAPFWDFLVKLVAEIKPDELKEDL